MAHLLYTKLLPARPKSLKKKTKEWSEVQNVTNASVLLFNTTSPAHQVAYGLRGLELADSQQ